MNGTPRLTLIKNGKERAIDLSKYDTGQLLAEARYLNSEEIRERIFLEQDGRLCVHMYFSVTNFAYDNAIKDPMGFNTWTVFPKYHELARKYGGRS